jgi:MYXO-CTERM domain-containing protein
MTVVALYSAAASAAMIDITRPGDPLEIVNGINQGDGDAGPPPAGEVESHAIDDVGQKYLNFLDLNSGFKVTPSANPGGLPVIGLNLYTANDAEPRDPASFILTGSNGDLASGPWDVIASGNLALPAGRNDGGNTVAIPPAGNAAAFYQQVLFTNTTSYDHYQIIFPTLKDAAAANSMQIGEVEFLVVPEPATATLGGLALLALGAIARRRR